MIQKLTLILSVCSMIFFIGCAAKKFHAVSIDKDIVNNAASVTPSTISTLEHKIPVSKSLKIKRKSGIPRINKFIWLNENELLVSFKPTDKKKPVDFIYQINSKKWISAKNIQEPTKQIYLANKKKLKWSKIKDFSLFEDFFDESFVDSPAVDAAIVDGAIDLLFGIDCPDKDKFYVANIRSVNGQKDLNVIHHKSQTNGKDKGYDCEYSERSICYFKGDKYSEMRCPTSNAVLSENGETLFEGRGVMNLKNNTYFTKQLFFQKKSAPPVLISTSPSPNFSIIASLYATKDALYFDFADLALDECATELIC